MPLQVVSVILSDNNKKLILTSSLNIFSRIFWDWCLHYCYWGMSIYIHEMWHLKCLLFMKSLMFHWFPDKVQTWSHPGMIQCGCGQLAGRSSQTQETQRQWNQSLWVELATGGLAKKMMFRFFVNILITEIFCLNSFMTSGSIKKHCGSFFIHPS